MKAIGLRIHDVVVQTPIMPPPADGDGAYVQSWIDATPRIWRVAIEPADATQAEKATNAGSTITGVTHIVTGPYHASLASQARLIWGTRILLVAGVQDPEERHRETIASCTEVT